MIDEILTDEFDYTLKVCNRDAISNLIGRSITARVICCHTRFFNKDSFGIFLNAPKDEISKLEKEGFEFVHNNPEIERNFKELPKSILGEIASQNFDQPSKRLKVIGVTGTKGKTTTGFIIYQVLNKLGFKTAFIGTLGLILDSTRYPLKNTTPSVFAVQKIFSFLIDSGYSAVVIECSSHGLYLGRLDGTHFDAIVFTGFGRDHLDFHKSLNNYFQAKAILFDLLRQSSKQKKLAIVNFLDSWAEKLITKYKNFFEIQTITLDSLRNVQQSFSMSSFEFDGKVFQVNFFSTEAMKSVASALRIADFLGASNLSLLDTAGLALPEGRFQEVVPNIFVDYAHTPESLEYLISSLKKLSGKPLAVVFGCGGNRDKEKRPIMGKVAEDLADLVILTSDNPRFEDPVEILKDILAGMRKKNHVVMPDRSEAIHYAVKLVAESDFCAVVAGKGHESYQILKDRKIEFDDREEIRKAYQKLAQKK